MEWHGIEAKMAEFEEFSEALFGQLSVELNEEKEILQLAEKINEDSEFKIKFDSVEDITRTLHHELSSKAEEFLGLKVPENLKIEFLELDDLKKMKGEKVFCTEEAKGFVKDLFQSVTKEDGSKIVELIKKDTAKYLVYSTYAIQYISKITTTYGDYLDNTIYLNKFILSRYPQIILYKQGKPFEQKFDVINSGYLGAIKMTILEEQIHSIQEKLQQINKVAAKKVNSINEELAQIVLDLNKETVNFLSEYLQLQAVPDEFPFAKKANLFFFLNPDHFLIEQIGPDVLTFTHVEIDPKISEKIPQLLDIYRRWLGPIQQHHAAFTAMEGMAGFAIQKILKDDKDFGNYLKMFEGQNISSYQVRKSLGIEFTRVVFEARGKAGFKQIIENPPNTRELKDPQLYLKRT